MPDEASKNADQAIINRAMAFMRRSEDAETTNRQEAQADLRFSHGEQWPAEIQNSRMLEQRPCLTINKLDAYIRKVANQQRQQRPRIKVQAVDSRADVKIADVISGICRHIEVNSAADTAYDNAFESALRMGWGYWRITTDYCRPDSFDQEIYIEPIPNPFSVYFDPSSESPDGCDQRECLVADMMLKEVFKLHYPNADSGANFHTLGTGDYAGDWITKDEIRVAEYFEVSEKADTLYMLADKSTVWEDQYALMRQSGMLMPPVIAERPSYRKKILWYKLTALEVLERREWAGRWIPIIPVFGNVVLMDGKKKRFGIVRNAKDPQKMYNYWRTTMTESVALAPKAKWLLAEGQDEGFEQEWMQANLSSRPILHFKQRDANNEPAPPPQRMQPEPPPEGAMVAAMAISDDLSSVLGIVEPAQRISGNVSGKALQAERLESDMSNFHFYDNLTRSIAHTGKVILDLAPKIYDTQRTLRIIGEDGRASLVTVNEKQWNDEGAVEKVLNDITVGEYDVVMDTGPGYNTKRAEAVEAFSTLLNSPLGEEVAKVGPDLAIRVIDAPGMDTLADRLAAANPLAQLDEFSDIPESAQMMIKSLQQKLQEAQGVIQAQGIELKLKGGIEQMKQQGETERELIKAHTKVHDTQSRDNTAIIKNREDNAAWMHDTAMKGQAQISVAELKGVVDLLKSHLDAAAAKEAADREERELANVE